MSTTVLTTPVIDPAFKPFLDRRVEPTWLTNLRLAAWEQYQSMNWPTRSEEDWMRSDLRGLHIDKYRPLEAREATQATCPTWLLDGVETDGQLRSVDGFVQHEQLSPEAASRGIFFGSLERACQTIGNVVEPYLMKTVDYKADKFAALQAASWASGAFIHVPRNVSVDKPLHIHSGMTDGGVDTSHILIVLEENASATVLCECSSITESSDGFHCGGLEIVLKPGAQLRFVKLQEWGDRVWHFAQQRAIVDRNASIQWTLAAMGAKFVQVAQQVSLVGEGASSQVNGTMFTRGKQQMTYNTLQSHEAPHCTSDFLYKAALQDRSRTVWRGMIKVAPGAFKTDGYQRNDNLMLSEHARADSIPGLEIKADDVRCTHGSTTGRVDDELIFYAQSCGFTRQEAVHLIVTGFFQQIFDRISIESVRKALGHAIARQVRQYE